MRGTVTLVLALTLWCIPAAAQTAPAPLPSPLWSNPARGPLHALGALAPSDSIPRNIQPTYWKEGALIGGAVGGLAGALLGSEFCRNSEQAGRNCIGSTIGGALVGALLLGLPAALIGGQFPKGASTE